MPSFRPPGLIAVRVARSCLDAEEIRFEYSHAQNKPSTTYHSILPPVRS